MKNNVIKKENIQTEPNLDNHNFRFTDTSVDKLIEKFKTKIEELETELFECYNLYNEVVKDYKELDNKYSDLLLDYYRLL